MATGDRAKAFVEVLACVLSRLVAANDQLGEAGIVTKFHALRPPSISIKLYLERINKYASCSPECFVLALVYIDRLIQRNSLLLTSLNVHRIIITSVMLASKFFDDQYFNNAYYAKVGGVPTPEVNNLELEFLFSVNFSLHVATDVFEKYYSELANHMGLGVPPEASALNTCDCASVAHLMAYHSDDLRHTGMRTTSELTAETMAAYTAAHGGAAASLTADADMAARVPAVDAPALDDSAMGAAL